MARNITAVTDDHLHVGFQENDKHQCTVSDVSQTAVFPHSGVFIPTASLSDLHAEYEFACSMQLGEDSESTLFSVVHSIRDQYCSISDSGSDFSDGILDSDSDHSQGESLSGELIEWPLKFGMNLVA